LAKQFRLPPEEAWAFTLIPPAISTQITSLSARQEDRLEAAGRFPKAVKLGRGRNGRKGRVLKEVVDWSRARIAERDKKVV
jgi:predicted DNA-binding transcriptional regulator AlpA